MASIKTNFIFNVLITLSTYLINLFLFPYVSRTLGVEMVGRIGFANNVIYYFSIFAMLGISNVGIREIAACGNNREQRSIVFSNIIVITAILTFSILAIYLGCIFLFPQFQTIRNLLLAGTFTLFFSSFMIEWFYQGLENFKYITIRSVVLKLLYATLVFFLIKSPNDYFLYFVLTVSVVVINSLINLFYANHFITFSFSNINIQRYIKPIFSLGTYRILVSMYTTFNVIFLGMVCSEIEVGYYYTSIKLFHIILGILFAFTGVMLPRMSSLLAQDRKMEFKEKINHSFELVIAFTIPTIICFTLLAPQIIRFLAGPEFDGAILPMQIVMPIILFSGMAQIWVIQILMPLKKDKIILLSSIIGAVVGLLSNLLIVRQNGAIGSAWVLLLSELAGNAVSLSYSIYKKYFVFPFYQLFLGIITGIPYAIICIVISNYTATPIITLCYSAIVCICYFYIQYRFVLRNNIIHRYMRKFLY